MSPCEDLLLKTLRLVESRSHGPPTEASQAEEWAVASQFNAKSEEWYAYQDPDDEKTFRFDVLSDLSLRGVDAL